MLMTGVSMIGGYLNVNVICFHSFITDCKCLYRKVWTIAVCFW